MLHGAQREQRKQLSGMDRTLTAGRIMLCLKNKKPLPESSDRGKCAALGKRRPSGQGRASARAGRIVLMRGQSRLSGA